MASTPNPDMEDVIQRVRDKMALENTARRRFGMGAPGMSARSNRFREAIRYYAPLNNDQWPDDRMLRPGKIHVTANMIRAYCDIISRLLSLQPRLINKPPTQDLESRKRAEVIEQFFYRLLEMTGWDVWLFDLNLSKEIFGVGVLKPYWNNDTKSPDVQVIEQPQNLMLGFGSNDYSVVDWSIYRYTVSMIEAQSRWPNAGIELTAEGNPKVAGVLVDWSTADKSDIVDQKGHAQASPAGGGTPDLTMDNTRSHMETYEMTHHLEVWDYWYREDGKIMNAVLLANRVVDGPNEHPELPIIPYLVSEAGHEPGSPEGLSTVELLRDVQVGYNRSISHWSQLVADNSGTAYQITGPTAGDVPEGVVPGSDEIIPVGENEIKPIQRNQNTYPINQLVDHYWELASRLTGIPEILFGQLAGAQTSGRATAVQIEAAMNRLDPKRRRLYQTLKDLLRIWGFMLSYKNIEVSITVPDPAAAGAAQSPEAPALITQKKGMKELLDGFDYWKIIGPEITPRDNIEATQNAANKVQAHLSSIESAMDEIGVDNPRHEMDLIRQELSDPRLNPGNVQSFISAVELLKTLFQQPANPNAAQNGQTGQNVQQAQDQQAQPTQFQDQNAPGNLPSAPGGPPPAGTSAPSGLELQGLIRQSGSQARAMNQVVLPPIRTGR